MTEQVKGKQVQPSGQEQTNNKTSHLAAKNMPYVWKCKSCKAVLGCLDETKEDLRIKYKDLFVYVRGGQVTVPCRSCGQINTVASDTKVDPLVCVPTSKRDIVERELGGSNNVDLAGNTTP